MSGPSIHMQISVEDRGRGVLRERLRERLDLTAGLVCVEHGATVMAVAIHDRENGWFDAIWTTCCEDLQQRAARILKERC